MSVGQIRNPQDSYRVGSNAAVSSSYTGLGSGLAGGTTFVFPTSAVSVRIRAGGNAADTAAGAGAQSILVEGLDGNFNPAMAVIATAGASASLPTTQTFIRVNRVSVQTVGSYGVANTGAIELETTAGTVLARVESGYGVSKLGTFTVPADTYALLKNIYLTPDSQKVSSVIAYELTSAGNVVAPMSSRRVMFEVVGISSAFAWNPENGISLPPKTDLWFEGKVASSTGFIGVQFEVDLLI
jgi:hypothetical protein